MNKRERVLAALGGRRVDRVPFTLWRHFYLRSQTARGLAQATLDFYRQCDPDMVVLTPGPFYMAESWNVDIRSFSTDDVAPYLVSPLITRATEWRRLPKLSVAASSLQREIEAVRQVRTQLAEDVPLVVSLFSPLTTANTLCMGRIVDDLRSFSNDVRSGLGVIATATREFATACLKAGADGFILVNRLASQDKLRIREYRDFGQRFDLEVLNGLEAQIRILYLEGEHLFFDLADRYPIQAVCWETWRAEPSLAGARRQVRCGLMGGINPMTFAHGSVADIEAQVKSAIAQTGGWYLLIASPGPVPIDSRDELLASISKVIQEL